MLLFLAFRRLALVCLFLFSLFASANERINLSNELYIDDYELIVDFHYKKYVISRDVFIYSLPETTLLPIQYLVDGVEFPIIVNPLSMTASGWYIDPANTFEIDFKNKTLFVKGVEEPFPDNAIVYSDGIDLYVESKLIEQLTPLTLTLNTSRLRLEISSKTKLAFETKLERESVRSVSFARKSKSYASIDDHYALAGPPVIDLTLGSHFIEDDSPFYTLQTSFDLLWFETYFSSTMAATNSSSKERLTFRKRPNNPNSPMLGGISFIEFGDSFAKSNQLIFQGGEGQGFNVDFGAVSDQDSFGKTNIEGDGTPGWEVELYRNGVLIDFVQIDASARYQFTDVELDYGDNVFDVRLYGPLGQTDHKREQINIDNKMLSEGTGGISLSYIDVGDPFIEPGFDDALDEKKIDISGQRGISKNLSISGGFSRHEFEQDIGDEIQTITDDYLNIGLSSALDSINLGVDYSNQMDKGWAGSVNGQTRLFDVSTTLSHSHYSDFESDRNSEGRLIRDTELRLNSAFQPFGSRPLQVNMKVIRETFQNIGSTLELDTQLGFQLFSGAFSVSNVIRNSDITNQIIDGRISYSQTITRSSQLRSSLNYSAKPSVAVNDSDVNITWHPTSNIRTNVGFIVNFNSGHTNSVSYSISKLYDAFSLSLSGESKEDGYNQVTLSLETSLSPVDSKGLNLSGKSRVNNGRLQVRSFLDTDHSNDWSEGDTPIAGVGLYGRSDWNTIKTNDEGIAYYPGLSGDVASKIVIDERSIEDPFWKVSFPDSKIYSHAGGLKRIDIPVHITVEIEGTITALIDGKEKPLPNIPVTAYQDGKPIATIKSEFDGYYVFTGLIPGQYDLLLDQAYLKRFNLNKVIEAMTIDVTAEDGVFYVDPFIVEFPKKTH